MPPFPPFPFCDIHEILTHFHFSSLALLEWTRLKKMDLDLEEAFWKGMNKEEIYLRDGWVDQMEFGASGKGKAFRDG